MVQILLPLGLMLSLSAQETSALTELPIRSWEALNLPNKPAKPLPGAADVLKRVLAQAQTVAQLADAYCYREVETEQKLNSKDQPTESQVSVFEVTRLPGGKQVRRLVESNGKPLSSEQAQAEEAKIQAFMQELQAPVAAHPSGKSITLTGQDLMEVVEVESISRTVYKGQPVLALSLHPRANAKSKSTAQRLAAKLQIRILVDEDSDQVVRAEGKLLDSYWVGAGLMGAVAPPTAFFIEQQKVAENLWMPQQMSISIHARITFVPLRRRVMTQCSEFRKFVVETPVLSK